MQVQLLYQELEPVRLDVFLTRELKQTRSLVQKSIKKGYLQVNNHSVLKSGHIVEQGDCITGDLELNPYQQENLQAENIPLEIVYEDEYLAVINKPAGLSVHPSLTEPNGTLVNGLLHRYEQLSNLTEAFNEEASFRPGIVHRLDKDTSGLLVIAKTNAAHHSLAEQLKQRTLKRIYWAIALGHFEQETGSIEAGIGRHPKNRKCMAAFPCLEGQNAENNKGSNKVRSACTHWRVIQALNVPTLIQASSNPKIPKANKINKLPYEPKPQSKLEECTLLEIKLETGRTHQIRVHFEYIKHPLLGDPVYGGQRTKNHLINRQALHAKEMSFWHPITKELMHFQIPLADDLLFVLGKLST